MRALEDLQAELLPVDPPFEKDRETVGHRETESEPPLAKPMAVTRQLPREGWKGGTTFLWSLSPAPYQIGLEPHAVLTTPLTRQAQEGRGSRRLWNFHFPHPTLPGAPLPLWTLGRAMAPLPGG